MYFIEVAAIILSFLSFITLGLLIFGALGLSAWYYLFKGK